MSTFVETTLEDFKSIFELDPHFLFPYIFRGQINKNWELATSLERAVINFALVRFGLTFGYETEEKWMLYEFKKKYPLYSSHLPKQSDNFEWLAIMQHYGAPTRLLDFTASFFIAMYFATLETKTDSAIWCVHRYNLRDLLHDRFNLNYEHGIHLKDVVNDIHIELANKVIAKTERDEKNKISSTIPLEPNIHTERLSKQQGLFLMPTNSTLSFFENLALSFDIVEESFKEISFNELINLSKEKKASDKVNILKIVIPSDLHGDINRYLKEMNITAESLFPGIDGLAKSLVQLIIRT